MKLVLQLKCNRIDLFICSHSSEGRTLLIQPNKYNKLVSFHVFCHIFKPSFNKTESAIFIYLMSSLLQKGLTSVFAVKRHPTKKKGSNISSYGSTIQSTLVISKSKGPSKTVRDIRTSTYQMCRIEENTKQTTKFHK